jgi:hypothetical protein
MEQVTVQIINLEAFGRSAPKPRKLGRPGAPGARAGISEPPATTPDATGKVNSLASYGLRLSIRSAMRSPRKNKSP